MITLTAAGTLSENVTSRFCDYFLFQLVWPANSESTTSDFN